MCISEVPSTLLHPDGVCGDTTCRTAMGLGSGPPNMGTGFGDCRMIGEHAGDYCGPRISTQLNRPQKIIWSSFSPANSSRRPPPTTARLIERSLDCAALLCKLCTYRRKTQTHCCVRAQPPVVNKPSGLGTFVVPLIPISFFFVFHGTIVLVERHLKVAPPHILSIFLALVVFINIHHI